MLHRAETQARAARPGWPVPRGCVRLAAVELRRITSAWPWLVVLWTASIPALAQAQSAGAAALRTPDAGIADAAPVSVATPAPVATGAAAPAAPAAPADQPAPAAPRANTNPSEVTAPAAAASLPTPTDLTAANSGEITEQSTPKSATIRYVLERVEIRGNTTRTGVIKRFVSIEPGELFDVDDPSIERIRWRLFGTGWFDDVKLSLARGKQKGWAILIIEVKERNTLVIDRFVAGLARVVTNNTTMQDSLRPYAGLGLAENNLFGLGIGVTAAGVVSAHQYGVDLGYNDRALLGTGYSLSGRAFYNYAREFFGRNPLVSISCPPPPANPTEKADLCDPDVAGKRAVVIYRRAGFGFGTGHDISGQLRYTLDWLGEMVDVLSKPAAASTERGQEIVPIDFRINDGVSRVSSLRGGLIFDARDHPALTTRGDLATFYGRLASSMLGSSYDFARFEMSYRHWLQLPWGHTLSLGAFAGTVFGDAPFFYDFYAADLSDLLPSRVLELNLDHRRTLNLLHTSIVEMDMEDLAGRLDFEYQLPLHRGSGFVRGFDAYAGAGLFLLTRRADLRFAISGYRGLSKIPVDLTFDLGVQADTEIGLLKLGFSTLIGFLPDLGQANP